MISYRNASINDVETIKLLAEKAWIPTYKPILSEEQLNFMFEKWYSKNEIERLIKSNEQEFFLQLENNLPIGYSSISSINPNVYKLNKIYILPNLKGQGLGKLFLNYIEDEVRKKGGKILELNVNRYNTAYHFYLKMGYIVIKEEDIPIGNYFMNDYIMQKDLMH